MQFLKMVRKLATAFQTIEQIGSKHVRTLGVTPGQFDVIATLGNQPPMNCKELAEKTLMVKGNLTVILGGLLKKGLISRNVNQDDKRQVTISLTKAGEDSFVKIFNEHLEYLEPLANSFSEQELTELIKCFDMLTQKFHAFDAKNI